MGFFYYFFKCVKRVPFVMDLSSFKSGPHVPNQVKIAMFLLPLGEGLFLLTLRCGKTRRDISLKRSKKKEIERKVRC